MYTFLVVSLTILCCHFLWKLIYLQIPVIPYISSTDKHYILYITLVEYNSINYVVYLNLKEKKVYMSTLADFNSNHVKFTDYIRNNYGK